MSNAVRVGSPLRIWLTMSGRWQVQGNCDCVSRMVPFPPRGGCRRSELNLAATNDKAMQIFLPRSPSRSVCLLFSVAVFDKDWVTLSGQLKTRRPSKYATWTVCFRQAIRRIHARPKGVSRYARRGQVSQGRGRGGETMLPHWAYMVIERVNLALLG